MQNTYYRGDGNIAKVEDHGLDYELKQTLGQRVSGLLDGPVWGVIIPDEAVDGRDLIRMADVDLFATTSYGGRYSPTGINTGYVYTKTDRIFGESSNTPKSYTWTFSKTTEARDTYLEKSVTGVASNVSSGSFNPASTTSTYDANGNRMAVEERKNGETKVEARHFFHSADSSLLRKYAGTQTSLLSDPRANTKAGTGFALKGAVSNYQYSNGNYLGELDTAGNVHFKDQHFSAPDASSTSSQRYNVRAGDTLQGIAQLFYGSSDYWYVIASANGLSNDSPLQEGTALDIPPRANSENRSDSFKPIDLAQIIGDTTPSLPYVPPPPSSGCNAIATIIMVAVAVSLTVGSVGFT